MKRFLVTGAAGFLGRAVSAELIGRGKEVYALVLKDDPLADALPAGVIKVVGDVCNEASLAAFFENADEETCVIHCAGIVSVASGPDERMRAVNVEGTRSVLKMCGLYGVARLVYVSSVHAIRCAPRGTVMTEPLYVSPELVRGEYARTKAEATRLVMTAARGGLNASIVYPSGIIGPGDIRKGSMTLMIQTFLRGKLPFAVTGGYDFVDVRDVAKGIADCAELGKPCSSYILSGHYARIRDVLQLLTAVPVPKHYVPCLPASIASLIAPLCEKYALRKNRPAFLTPYSIEVLASNGRFSCLAAERDLGYSPRPLAATLRDTVNWLQDHPGCRS